MTGHPIVPARLPVTTRLRMRLRRGRELASDVHHHGSRRRMWWLAPVIAAMLVIALAVSTTSAALPVAVYTLF
jgi:hypothetical protein